MMSKFYDLKFKKMSAETGVMSSIEIDKLANYRLAKYKLAKHPRAGG